MRLFLILSFLDESVTSSQQSGNGQSTGISTLDLLGVSVDGIEAVLVSPSRICRVGTLGQCIAHWTPP